MSVILPYQYKYLADKLGEMYAKIRDAYYKEGDPTAVYNIAQATLKQPSDPPTYSTGGIEAESDGTNWGCAPPEGAEDDNPDNAGYSQWIGNSAKYTAPPGSISRDLGTFWFQFVNTSFNSENAKALATTQVASALRNLNSHVVNRMSADAGGTDFTVSNIQDYYNNYAYVDDATAASVGMSASQLSLFDLGDESDLDASPTYFTADFKELCERINVDTSGPYFP